MHEQEVKPPGRSSNLAPIPTSTVEDYLNQILLEEEERGEARVPTGRLAQALAVTPGTVTTMVNYGTLGYRFGQGSIVPYVGLGGGISSYEETSTVGGLVETTSADKASFHGLVGVEFVTGPLRIGVEGVYQSVPDAFGESGVSRVYDESDAGGLLVLGKLTFTFGSK